MAAKEVNQVQFTLVPAPSSAVCRGTAGSDSPHVACPRRALWQAHMRYEYKSALFPAVYHTWFACDVHVYPIAQWHHRSIGAQDQRDEFIAAAAQGVLTP